METVLLAGATGGLGRRIARALLERGARVRVLARPSSSPDALTALRAQGADVAVVGYDDRDSLTAACAGGTCLVSALNGLEDVIVAAQTRLLEAALAAEVPRFVPSDFSMDFTKLTPGTNRNLDLRRRFASRLDESPIAATSILNGAFADMLTGQAPFILFRLRRVLVWESADQLLDFTTIDDVATYTALVAMAPSTPRWLRIAGDQISARGLAAAASEASGKRFGLLRAGGLRRLDRLIGMTRFFAKGSDQVFPPWQGMQYMRDMFSGQGKLESLDNDRFPGLDWTTARDVLDAHLQASRPPAAARP